MTTPTPQPAATLLDALRRVLERVAEPIQVLKTILDQAVVQTKADRGIFVEVTRDGALAYRVLHRFERKELNGEAEHYSRSIFAHVRRTGQEILLENALADPRFMTMESVQDLRLASILCMPILVGGKVAALVYLEHSRTGHFRGEHREILGALLAVAGPVLETLHAGHEVIVERDRLRVSERRVREELEESREILARDWSFGRFVGRSAVVRELEEIVRRAAASEFPVLLLGETGTGKSILARILHHTGPRSKQAFVTVFCPSLEKGMVEAELFGHKKGAFTGAIGDRAGKVRAAERGTLFLDEIGDLPVEMQAKLLRLLQEKTYERIGDPAERSANVRVIAATNRDLEEEVHAGRFRRDLYERLNYVPIRVPPLRERTEDIPALLRYCLDQHEAGRWVEISHEGLDYLAGLDFTWPGNVRHLEQLAARLTLERGREPVTREAVEKHLGARRGASGETAPAGPGVKAPSPSPDPVTPSHAAGAGTRSQSADPIDAGLPALLEHSEKVWLEEALRRYPGVTRAQLAERLKISESALYKKLRQHGLGS